MKPPRNSAAQIGRAPSELQSPCNLVCRLLLEKKCLGIRKIGKTSIINRIISEVREHQACYLVLLDCSKDEIWHLCPDGLMTSLFFFFFNDAATTEIYTLSLHAAFPI